MVVTAIVVDETAMVVDAVLAAVVTLVAAVSVDIEDAEGVVLAWMGEKT